MEEKTRKPQVDTAEAARTSAADQGAKKHHTMTRQQAKRYIACLTFEEKQKLNELLKVLEQKRQPSQVLLHSVDKDA